MPEEIAGHPEADAPAEAAASAAAWACDAGLSVAGSNPVEVSEVERFAVAVAFAPSSADDDNRTIDAVWYTGAKVPRFDWRTGEEYDLILSMKGCRLDRLNNGGPVLDSHMRLRRGEPARRCAEGMGREDHRQGDASSSASGIR